LPKSSKLVYLYIGRYGQNNMDWSRLERYADRGIQFISYPPAPEVPVANLHVVPSPDWPGGDIIGSCDAVLVKAGYGAVCEAMASGKPVIYPPRQGFSEYRLLDRALRAWGGGVPISARDFRELKLDRSFDRAFQIEPGAPPFPADGADRIARYLAGVCRHRERMKDEG
jgi:hypothetical protein